MRPVRLPALHRSVWFKANTACISINAQTVSSTSTSKCQCQLWTQQWSFQKCFLLNTSQLISKRKTWTPREHMERRVEKNKEWRSEWKRMIRADKRGGRADKNSVLCSQLSAMEVWWIQLDASVQVRLLALSKHHAPPPRAARVFVLTDRKSSPLNNNEETQRGKAFHSWINTIDMLSLHRTHTEYKWTGAESKAKHTHTHMHTHLHRYSLNGTGVSWPVKLHHNKAALCAQRHWCVDRKQKTLTQNN